MNRGIILAQRLGRIFCPASMRVRREMCADINARYFYAYIRDAGRGRPIIFLDSEKI